MWTSYLTLISINNIEEYIYLLFDIYLFEYFWNSGFETFCSEKLLEYIICIDVNITCTYNTLVYFVAQYDVYKSPVTCLGYKGHSEVVKKEGAFKGGEDVEKSKFSYVRTKWMAPGLLALFSVRYLEKRS